MYTIHTHTDSCSCSFINDEPVHTRWQIATWMLLSPICFACVYMCVFVYVFFYPLLFFSWFELAFLVCCLCVHVLFCFSFEPSFAPSLCSQILLETNCFIHIHVEKSVCIHVYANMVHLNIYLSGTVDATRIWLICDRNLRHNFKLKECSNITTTTPGVFECLLTFALSYFIVRSLHHIRLIKSRA